MNTLRNQANDCYAEGDASCVRNVYLQLAFGGYLQGTPTAARMMLNHLILGNDMEISSDEILADGNAKAAVDELHLLALDEAADYAIAQGAGTYDLLRDYQSSVSASGDNLWYAMGRFTIKANPTAVVTANNDGTFGIEITMNFNIEDIYDWHPEQGLQAGGNQQGVAGFQDAWGQLLVDEGLASEFTMSANWSETKHYHLTIITVNGDS